MSDSAIVFGEGGDVHVEGALLAAQLRLTEAHLREGMRDGSITSRVERGEGEDEGRWRLTVFTPACRLRLIVDAAGTILQSDRVDFGDQPLPSGMRR